MKKAQIGQYVVWTHDSRGSSAIRLTGRVESIDGGRARVRANNSLYDVHIHLLRSAHRCVVCGATLSKAVYYCSKEHYAADIMAETDDRVFEIIVQYKAEHDGCSPNISDIVRIGKLYPASVGDSIHRLEQAGRLQTIGKRRNWKIIVPGGRWVYEGAGSGNSNQNMAKQGAGQRKAG